MKTLLINLLLLTGGIAVAQQPKPRPNIILIYTDDQRFDALSVVQKEQGD